MLLTRFYRGAPLRGSSPARAARDVLRRYSLTILNVCLNDGWGRNNLLPLFPDPLSLNTMALHRPLNAFPTRSPLHDVAFRLAGTTRLTYDGASVARVGYMAYGVFEQVWGCVLLAHVIAQDVQALATLRIRRRSLASLTSSGLPPELMGFRHRIVSTV